MERLGNLLRKVVPPRDLSKPESTSTNLSLQSDLCKICEGRGWLKVSQGKEVVLCVCEEATDLDRRIARFNRLPNDGLAVMTFGTWITRPGAEEAMQLAWAMSQGQAPFSILVLQGGYGNGKTHLLAALVNELTSRRQFARYRYVPTLLQELRTTFDREDGPRLTGLLESYGQHGFLALDDLGAGKTQPTPWSVEMLETIVNARYESGRGLLVSTNLGIQDIAERWSPRIAERLFDRRTGRAKQTLITAASYRTGESW